MGGLGPAAAACFNEQVNEQIERTRDDIVAHDKTGARQDSDYWRANAANRHLSEPLKQRLAAWMAGRRIAEPVQAQQLGRGDPVLSWYALLCGMGLFPDVRDLRPPSAEEACFSMAEIDDFIARSAANFPDRRPLLAAIPPARHEPALQLYCW